MAVVECNGKKIYYETHGEGEPLVIFNGVIMSTKSWAMFVPEFSKNRQLVLFDFLDQLQSDKMDSDYKQDVQVDAALAVVDALGFDTFDLLGISYGAEVALQFVIANKARVKNLLLFNTTAYTNAWLKDIGVGWVKAATSYDKELFYSVTIPIIYSPQFYVKNIEWMNGRRDILNDIFTEEFLDSAARLTRSADYHDVRDRLGELEGLRTLIVGSDYDFVTPTFEQEFLHEHIPGSKLHIMKDCGHASMYEKPDEFVKLVTGFLEM